ncbi:MAG: hypothetical protein LBH12_00965 [Dysgonamonadaceae bacterium]|jgi:hypothetical protein|nr:hypothetical protein [Dysgonamonadaceae bacterium]
MKRLLFYTLLFCFFIQTSTAQQSQTVTTTESGKLKDMVKNPETVKVLKVSGLMDARDFFFLRDNCRQLEDLDIKNVKITAYADYPANTVPEMALSQKANTENWLELRLNDGETPIDISATKKVFLTDKSTDLSAARLTASIPDGATISPNPSTVTIRDGEPVNFYVTSENGERAEYQCTVYLDNWFTVIVCGDSEIGMRSNDTGKMQEYVRKAINIRNYPEYKYSKYSFIAPSTSLFIMAGDMDGDRGGELSVFDNVFKQVTDAGIPLITISGNHDWEPDYWDDNSAGYSYLGGGFSSNKRTLNVVDTYISRSQSLGISDVHVFTSQHEGQVKPFSFKFRNVRFYMGQNYWFQPPYSYGGLFSGYEVSFHAPDDEIINPLEMKINSTWKDDAAVWIQHYPFNCADKWWLNQNGNGKSKDSNKGRWGTANEKREKLKELIRMTKNPYFFSGHNHAEAVYTHQHAGGTFKEYIAGYFPEGRAFMVLMREGIGVMEVKSIQL